MKSNPLAPCLVGNGTVTGARDMVRALQTLETFDFVQEVDGEVMAEGRAALVKLMADADSATILVNGCLFLNVLSFHYLTFTTDPEGRCTFRLAGDGTALTLTPLPDADPASCDTTSMRLLEEDALGHGSFVALDEDDDED
jgi:hypothetical protein